MYAGGWEYLLIAAAFYLFGTIFFVWARREAKLPVFTRWEWIPFGLVVLGTVWMVLKLATNSLNV